MSTWRDLKDNPRLNIIYRQRCALVRLIRKWFWAQGFTEAATPLAVRFPGQEPHLNPAPITVHDAAGRALPMYLHTSPEYSLKKLLAAGFPKIFELTKTFRDRESFGGLHNPEFTMLEWYRAPGTVADFMSDAEALFKFVGGKLKIEDLRFPAPGGSASGGKDHRVIIDQRWERKSMKELWPEYARLNLDDNLEIEQLRASVIAKGCGVSPRDRYDDLFFKIFLNEIEPYLGFPRPLWVYDYPLSMCSLSRPSSTDPRYGERAELYIAGLELANGFGELLDAREQERRLEADRAFRQELHKPTWPVDQDFIAALESGIPAPAAGVALGVDRMVLLFTGAKDINEVIFQSVSDQFES